jgi:hypothetical protein
MGLDHGEQSPPSMPSSQNAQTHKKTIIFGVEIEENTKSAGKQDKNTCSRHPQSNNSCGKYIHTVDQSSACVHLMAKKSPRWSKRSWILSLFKRTNF